MAEKIGIYANSRSSKVSEDQIINCFSDMELDIDAKYAPGRGGEYLPDLSVCIEVGALIVGQWILQGVGSDFYDRLKKSLKKLLKLMSDKRCKSSWVILSFNYNGHSFIIDFDMSDSDNLDKSIKLLPALIEKLSLNQYPSHHLIHWDKSTRFSEAKWSVTLYPQE